MTRTVMAIAIALAGVALAAGPARATTVVYLGDDALIDGADRIVHGEVLERTVHVSTDGARIYTEYRLRVLDLLKGAPESPQAEIVFREWGGALPDGTGMWIPGRGDIEVGEEVVLLLGEEDTRTGVLFTTGLSLGKLHVRRGADGEKRIERTLEGLRTIAPGGGDAEVSKEARTLESWKERIRARAKNRTR